MKSVNLTLTISDVSWFDPGIIIITMWGSDDMFYQTGYQTGCGKPQGGAAEDVFYIVNTADDPD